MQNTRLLIDYKGSLAQSGPRDYYCIHTSTSYSARFPGRQNRYLSTGSAPVHSARVLQRGTIIKVGGTAHVRSLSHFDPEALDRRNREWTGRTLRFLYRHTFYRATEAGDWLEGD